MSRRNKQHSPTGSTFRLGSAKTTEGYETRDQYYAREKREAEDRKSAGLRQSQDELRAELRANEDQVRRWFSQPIDKLVDRDPCLAPTDHIGNYEQQVGDRDDAEAAATFQKFGEKLDTLNVTLDESAWARVGRFIAMLTYRRGIAITLDNFSQALERMSELQLFAPGEVVGEIPHTPVPKSSSGMREQWELAHPGQSWEKHQAKSRDERFESIPTLTREGQAKALKIVGDQWGSEVQAFYGQWAEQMQNDYQVNVVTEPICRFVGEYFNKWNLNPLRHASYNKARIAAARLGMFGSRPYQDFMTGDEINAEMIDSANLNDRQVRNDFVRNIRILQQGR